MKLTTDEKRSLDGKHGKAAQKAMELLVAVGDCFGAERMVPVSTAHLVSVNPVIAGEGGAAFIKRLAEMGGKFVVPATTNVACLDPWAWKELRLGKALYQQHVELSEAIDKMGGLLCYTCTPYLIGNNPSMGQHVAWGESSAVIFANGALGARTNREGGPTSLAAAITGRTPAYGYHLDENRYGQLEVVVSTDLKTDADYGILGFYIGGIAQDRVPIFTGMHPQISQDELKCLGAGLASSGSVAHYHVVGVTPEAPTEKIARGPNKIDPSDTFEFGFTELKKTKKRLSTAGPEEADLVILGCPHASITQIKDYAKALSGRKLKDTVEVWILVSHIVKTYAEDLGYAKVIESAGARLVNNACPNNMPVGFFKKCGYNAIATDSAKMAYYVALWQDVRTYCGGLDSFVDVITVKR